MTQQYPPLDLRYPPLDRSHDDVETEMEGQREDRPDPKRIYTISQFMNEFRGCKVTPRALHIYENRGLLSPRRAGGRRFYSHRDHTRLAQILRGKNLGYTLRRIKVYLALRDEDFIQAEPTEALEKTNAALEELAAKKYDLEQEVRDLKRIRDQCLLEIEKARNRRNM